MGLFSGSFGTGFVTGLASSVDKSLQTAMDKREEELSEARKYALTMQRKKQERADEQDKRAKKALDRLIRESNGNVAMGLAAYQAAGGEVDQVEGFISSMDETRNKGMDYSLTDKLNLEGVDLSQFKDLTRERAFGAIRTEVTPASTLNLEDTSGLQKIGLGMKDMGAGISEKINEMIPAREREAIEGITGAVLDRSGMYESEQYRREVEASVPNMKTQLSTNLAMISSGKDAFNKPLPENRIAELEKDNNRLIANIANLARIEADATRTGPSLGEFASNYNVAMNRLEDSYGYSVNSTTGIVTIQPPDSDAPLEGPEALAFLKQIRDRFKSEWISTNLFDSTGNYVSKDAEDFAGLSGLGKTADTIRTDILGATQTQDDDDPDPLKLNIK